jgi:ADP-ribose pyrophosphatase
MQELNEEKISGEQVYNGVLLKVQRDEVRFPDGTSGVREWVEHPGATAVIPVTEQSNVIMVEQFRYPLNRITLEIPAGKIDPGETVDNCARRELKEETGLHTDQLIKIGSFATTPAFTDEVIHLYLATELTREESHTDPDEFLSITELPLEKIMKFIRNGTIQDAKTIIAFLLAKEQGLL